MVTMVTLHGNHSNTTYLPGKGIADITGIMQDLTRNSDNKIN